MGEMESLAPVFTKNWWAACSSWTSRSKMLSFMEINDAGGCLAISRPPWARGPALPGCNQNLLWKKHQVSQVSIGLLVFYLSYCNQEDETNFVPSAGHQGEMLPSGTSSSELAAGSLAEQIIAWASWCRARPWPASLLSISRPPIFNQARASWMWAGMERMKTRVGRCMSIGGEVGCNLQESNNYGQEVAITSDLPTT